MSGARSSGTQNDEFGYSLVVSDVERLTLQVNSLLARIAALEGAVAEPGPDPTADLGTMAYQDADGVAITGGYAGDKATETLLSTVAAGEVYGGRVRSGWAYITASAANLALNLSEGAGEVLADCSVSLGYGSFTREDSVSIGCFAKCGGNESVSVGKSAAAAGTSLLHETVAVGHAALESCISGEDNVAIGHRAASGVTSMRWSTIIGSLAGDKSDTTYDYATIVGAGADTRSATANYATIVGGSAEVKGETPLGGHFGLCLGYDALADIYSVAVGAMASTNGAYSIAIGFLASAEDNNITLGGEYNSTGITIIRGAPRFLDIPTSNIGGSGSLWADADGFVRII